ncbi:uncharacterized protein LOC135836566 [Planococcus citri]|uniref:uncharacterized protein LOC135836566 n=1 Tax=Planococcus citri TaxID=170843 RepID=UPI0031F84702
MAEMNFVDFQMKVLRGIGYNNVSTTNRAYQWIKSNSTIDGPCLNYLKNYVTEDNFITQKEMNMYKNIISQDLIPISEEEIDKALEEFYLEDAPMAGFNHSDTFYVENELEKAETYLKELEFSKRLLQRQYNKVQDEINVLRTKNKDKETNIENASERAKKIDRMYEETSKKLQNDLNQIGNTFHKLTDKNVTEEEHSIFTINFEIFKKINCTFRDSIDFILEKQFGKIPVHITDSENETDPSTLNKFLNDDLGDWKKAEDLVSIVLSLGDQTFKNLMIKCEEAELGQLTEFLRNLKFEITAKNSLSGAGIACLQAQISINDETTEEYKKKSEQMQNSLEKFHKNNPLHEILLSEKLKVEQKSKNDKKCVRKISELCSKYADLITVQACLLENERENVTLAVDLYKRGIDVLGTQEQKHLKAMENLEKLKNQPELEQNTNTFLKSTLNLLNLVSSDPAPHKMVQKYPKAVCGAKKKIVSLVDEEFRRIQSIHTLILELDEIVFNGPAKQPFHIVDLMADKRIIELRYAEFSKIYRGFKTKYNEEMEKLNNDEYLKLEKLLWIMFLTDPTSLQDNLVKLRQRSGANKSLNVRKGESMFVLKDNKVTGTSFY